MDDAQLVYSEPDRLDARLGEAKALGFDRVRISVYWRLLAPDPDKKQKPSSSYPASDPRFYGDVEWDRYDRIAALAAKHGIGVLFTLTGPAPLWATGTPEGGRRDVEDTWEPSAREFGDSRRRSARAIPAAGRTSVSSRGSIKRVTVGNRRGFLYTKVRARRSGSYPIAWAGDARSRSVAVSVRR